MKQQKIPLLIALAVFALGCAVAFFESRHLAASQQAEKNERFTALAERTVRQLTRRMQIYEYGLRGARGAVLTAGIAGLNREKFLAYSETRELSREFPGARGFGFIRRVSPEEEGEFLRRARDEGRPDLRIRQLKAHAGDRLVIQYIEPEAANREALGLDIASEDNRRHAASAAIRTGQPTLTHPITLVQAGNKPQQGLLFLLPIYRPDQPAATPAEREQAYYGLAYTPLQIDEVLTDFDFLKGDFSLALNDLDAATRPQRFYASLGADEPTVDGLVQRVRLPIYGREWEVEIKARAGFVTKLNHQDRERVAAEMVLASALVAILVYLLAHTLQRHRQSTLDHAKLAAIVESSTDAIIGKDLNGVVTSWNSAAETIFGYAADEAIGRPLRDLIVPPELAGEEDEILGRIRRGLSVPHRTAVRRRKDGELIDVSITVSPIRAGDGRVVGASKTVRDVTDEIRKERRFRLAIDASGVGVWVWHLQSNQLSWDERMFELYGSPASLKESGLYYDYWKAHVHPDDIALAEEKLRQHIAGEGLYDPVFRIRRDDGSQLWIQASATLERDHTGKPLQMVGTNLDITEQTLARTRILELNASLEAQVAQRTAELQEAVAVAQRANEAKSLFLSNMSHEIRTPMNAILNLAYLLKKQDLPLASRPLVDKIHGAGKALLGIINDILDFSKIEAKKLEIEDVPFRLSDVLDNLASIMAAAVGDKPVETLIAPPPPGADFLRGDGLRLGQILINLVSNALKFTERGEVVLHIDRLDSAPADRVKLRFAVRDTGIGIPKDKQAAIFKAFSQVDSSTTRCYGGTGLGLTISSRLVELMGGVLEVYSEPGQGSEFSFAITLGLSDPSASAVPEMAHQRVLIADDQPSARAVLADTVNSLGWYAEAVDSGEQVISRAGADVAGDYDILLLDWRMPRMDGLQAARRIRESRGQDSMPIIIMVTAFDREQLQHHPGGDLADVVLTKPVTSSSLYNAVQQAKSHRGELGPSPVTPPDAPRLTGVRVLVVDDSEINREVAAGILQGEGARVEAAEDGSVAVAMLDARPDAFDVVLMDMQMPVLDGYDATRQLRTRPALARLPVIALTAGAFAAQRNQALAAGVNAFVAKPFEVDELIQAILRLAPPAPEPASPPAAAPLSPAAGLAVLNPERGAVIWKDSAAYHRILRKFALSHDDTVAALGEAEPEQARKLAHRLRGTAAQLGLEQVAALAAEVETGPAEGPALAPLLSQLQAAMNAALSAIAALAPADAEGPPPAAAPAPDPERLSHPLGRLLAALDDDDIRLAEPAIGELMGHLPEEHLSPLRAALANYDFRGAEAVVRTVVHHYQIEVRR